MPWGANSGRTVISLKFGILYADEIARQSDGPRGGFHFGRGKIYALQELAQPTDLLSNPEPMLRLFTDTHTILYRR